MTDIKKSATKVVTGKVRASYCQIFKARAMDEGETPKFSVSLLIKKTDTVTLKSIERAVEAAKAEGKASKWGGTIPGNLKLPMRDGDIDRPDKEEYKGMMFVNANTTTRPEIVDRDGDPIIEASDVVSGDYIRASVNFYPFVGKSKGVACGLGNIQLLAKGEPLSGGSSAKEDFADAYEDEGEDDLV